MARAEDWRWSSLHRRMGGPAEDASWLCDPPIRLRQSWVEHVNQPQSEAEEWSISQSIARGRPYGSESRQEKVARQLNLQHTFRPRGRSKKEPG